MANERVMLLDTTLRDGEQSAGIGMTGAEKMEIARQLQRMNVDIIEAGFAASSPGDFEAVSNIAKEVKGPIIASLARAHPNDVDQAWRAVEHSERPRVHVFLSSSEIHQMHQLRKNREEVMEMAVTMVERAKGYCPDVEFSPMDATRTNPEYLYQMLTEVIRAGATTINIADTVGYAIPSANGFAQLLQGRPGQRAGNRKRGAQRSLPQRPWLGRGQQPDRHRDRCPAGRRMHQRHRRARRERLAGRDHHGP